jgi:hypothetical protein
MSLRCIVSRPILRICFPRGHLGCSGFLSHRSPVRTAFPFLDYCRCEDVFTSASGGSKIVTLAGCWLRQDHLVYTLSTLRRNEPTRSVPTYGPGGGDPRSALLSFVHGECQGRSTNQTERSLKCHSRHKLAARSEQKDSHVPDLIQLQSVDFVLEDRASW